MYPVVEGNFCEHGSGVVFDLVKSDVQSIVLFGGAVQAVCTQAVHTDVCRARFHRKRITIAAEDAATFVRAHLALLQRRPLLLTEARNLLLLGGPLLYPAVAGMEGRVPCAREVFGARVERWAKQTLEATALLAIAPALSRDTLVIAAERCLGDEAAVQACRDYAAWLSLAPAVGGHRCSPLHEVAAMAAAAVRELPAELVLAILALALPRAVFNAWRSRQNHVARQSRQSSESPLCGL